jgi:glutamate/tyrosine decarboxylase-like PLP-dependent enzyme
MMQDPVTTTLLLPDSQERSALWHEAIAQAESYFETIRSLPVTPQLDMAELTSLLDAFPLDEPSSRIDVLHRYTAALSRHQVHTPHPCYFGLFNPAPTFMGIMGDLVVATFNPQLAAWSHSPLAAETERRLIEAFAAKFGLPRDSDGCLTIGGAEANQTALLCALAMHWPGIPDDGLQSLSVRPAFYASAESHHSFLKATRMAGLGRAALRTVPVDAQLQMDPAALRQTTEQDRKAGFEPFLIVGTAGTTSAGVIDPLLELSEIARANGLWFHVDAAWGGAAALVPEFRSALSGIETADSVTFDPHKYLSVPMGAGMFITRHPHILSSTFSVTTAYMPKEGERLAVVDPFSHSLQWSRRFIGLKLFLTLATTGWNGYAQIIRHQAQMGDLLRERLTATGWRVVNRTPLPTVCFIPANESWDMSMHRRACDAVLRTGRAWISTVFLDGKLPALRACISNYRTGPEDIETLIDVLATVRNDLAKE